MIRNVIIGVALILFVLIMVVTVIESVKDSPVVIFNKLSSKIKEVKVDKASPIEGERLSYSIKYLGVIPVGVAEIEINEKENYGSHRIYPLVAKAKTPRFITALIKAEGRIKSYVDARKLYPWRYEEKSQAEGHRPSNKVILYNQDANIMEFKGIKRKIPKNTQDPLSALFYLRWQDYLKERDIVISINSNKENYTLSTKVLNRKIVKHKKDANKLLVLQSQIKSPKQYSKSEARIITYLTDDAARIPLLLKIKTKFGSLVVRLIGVEYK